MKQLLSDYIFSDHLRYEAHQLIYTPESGEPIALGGILGAALLCVRLLNTEEQKERGFFLHEELRYELRDRDYKHNPRTHAEQEQYERWKAVCQEASRIAKDPTHPRYQEMAERHMAQLKGKPDSALGKKRICQFGNFIRAVLVRE